MRRAAHLRPVVVLGDALLDVTVRPSRVPAGGADVPATIRLATGGQGANVAVRLARRGLAVELHCALGDDPAGGLVRAALAADGVRAAAVNAAATGTVVLLLAADGERTMLSQRQAFAAEVTVPGDAGWVVVSGYLLAEDAGPRLAGRVAAVAARRVVLGCALDGPAAAERWLAAARAARPELLVLNAREAALLASADGGPGDLAARLAGDLSATVVVTDASGAHAATAGGQLSRAGATGGAVVDTTGAGDAVAAGMIAALAAGDDLGTALAAGVSLGAAVAGVDGAQGRVAGEPPLS